MRMYRGKQRWGDDAGKRVFGSLLILGLRYYIVPIPPSHETPANDITMLAQISSGVEVIPESVEQSTGEKDRNNVEIYSGDIVKPLIGKPYAIEFKGHSCYNWGDRIHGYYIKHPVEIIGNVTDTPEKLEQ